MANFHTNFLVIAAREQDMCKVLDRFAANIAASGADDFSLDQYQRATSLEERYYEVYDALCNNYMESLSTTFAGSEGYSVGVPMQVGTATVTIAMAPHGRGLSDSASVSMERCGDVLVLTLNYSTAWSANTDDIDAFFTGLPAGEYGVAFYDADEGDGYEAIGCFCGLHHGMGALKSASPVVRHDWPDMADLVAERRRDSDVNRSTLSDLAEIAHITATRDWPEYWSDDEGDGWGEGGYYETVLDGHSLSVWGRSTSSWGMPSVNWQHPSEDDLRKIDEALLKDLAGLPWLHRVDTTSAQAAEAAESLMAGDLLVARTHWTNQADDTTIELLDKNGVTLSVLKKWQIQLGYENSWMSLSGICSLSCLMPYLVFHVADIRPMSLRNKGVDRAEITIRVDVTQVDLAALLDEVHQMLAQEPYERTRTSIAAEVR